MTSSPVTTATQVICISDKNKVVRYDNICIAVTGTPDATTLAYHDANDITSMTENGTATNFM